MVIFDVIGWNGMIMHVMRDSQYSSQSRNCWSLSHPITYVGCPETCGGSTWYGLIEHLSKCVLSG